MPPRINESLRVHRREPLLVTTKIGGILLSQLADISYLILSIA